MLNGSLVAVAVTGGLGRPLGRSDTAVGATLAPGNGAGKLTLGGVSITSGVTSASPTAAHQSVRIHLRDQLCRRRHRQRPGADYDLLDANLSPALSAIDENVLSASRGGASVAIGAINETGAEAAVSAVRTMKKRIFYIVPTFLPTPHV